MFVSKNFIVSGLIFKPIIHFEFSFVHGVRKCSNFILLHVAVQFSQYHLLKRLSLLHCIFLPALPKIMCSQVCGFISGLFVLFHWSIFLLLCQYHTVLMTVDLQYNLKSGRLIYLLQQTVILDLEDRALFSCPFPLSYEWCLASHQFSLNVGFLFTTDARVFST